MQIDPITAALGSTAASTTSVNGVNCLLYTSPSPRDA